MSGGSGRGKGSKEGEGGGVREEQTQALKKTGEN